MSPSNVYTEGIEIADALITAEHKFKDILEMDNFTLEDRKELIKQSYLLEQFTKDIRELKDGVKDSLHKMDIEKADKNELGTTLTADHEKRLASLEKANDKLMTQIKTIVWLGGLIIVGVQSIIEYVLHFIPVTK